MRTFRFLGLILLLAVAGFALDWANLSPEAVLGGGLVSFAVLLGTGIMPGGAIGTELVTLTRRAFIPSMIVQVGDASPLLASALSNAQMASGGVSSVTVPVQGRPFVTAEYTDYGGGFSQAGIQQGASEADFNLKALVVPIPFLGFEGLVQLDAAVVPRIEAVMNDAGNQAAITLATDMAQNATNGTIRLDGLPLIAAATGTYGNLDRTTETYWRGNAQAGPGGTPAPTRAHMVQYIASANKAAKGEMPTMGVCGLGTWALLSQDFLSLEQYRITPDSAFSDSTQGARSSFTALSVMGVPIYADPYVPEGLFYFFNTRYISFYIHEAAAFAFTGFASTLPVRQLGYIGAVVVVLEFLCVKPCTVTRVPGFASLTI